MYLAVLQFGESGGDGCVGSRTRPYGREVITAQPVSHLDLENSRLAPTSKFVVLMEGRSGGERFIMRERVEFTMLSTPPLPPQGARHRHPTHCLSSPSPMNWNAQCQPLEIVVVLHAFGRMRCQPLANVVGIARTVIMGEIPMGEIMLMENVCSGTTSTPQHVYSSFS